MKILFKENKSIIIAFLALIGCILLLQTMCNKAAREGLNIIKEGVSKHEPYIGRSIVIDNDTLTIVDYNFSESNFTLSNNVKVNQVLVTNYFNHPLNQ